MKNNIKYQKFEVKEPNFTYYIDENNKRYIHHYSYSKYKVYEFSIIRYNLFDLEFGIKIRKYI